MRIVAITFLLLLIGNKNCFGDLFTESSDLIRTFRLEEQVVGVLSDLVAQMEAKLEPIRRYSINNFL